MQAVEEFTARPGVVASALVFSLGAGPFLRFALLLLTQRRLTAVLFLGLLAFPIGLSLSAALGRVVS